MKRRSLALRRALVAVSYHEARQDRRTQGSTLRVPASRRARGRDRGTGSRPADRTPRARSPSGRAASSRAPETIVRERGRPSSATRGLEDVFARPSARRARPSFIVYIDSPVLLRVVLGEPDRLREWRRIERPVSSELIRLARL